MVLLEAMTSGCYIVSTDGVAPIHDLISNDSYGLIAKIDDINDFADKLKTACINDSYQADKISNFAVNNFSWRNICDELGRKLGLGADMNNFKNLTKGIASGIINKIVGLLLPFVSRTVLIYTLGLSYVGLNSLFSSVLQVLNFSELGLGSAIVYLLYKPLAENNTVQVNRILSFCKNVISSLDYL